MTQVPTTSDEYRLSWLAPGPYIIEPPQNRLDLSRSSGLFPGNARCIHSVGDRCAAWVDFTGVDLKLTESRAVSLRGDVAIGLTGQAPFRPQSH